MNVAITIVLAFIGFWFHEIAHAIEMKKQGIKITAVNLGYPVPKWPSIKFKIMSLPFALNLLMLGGVVTAPKEELEEMGLLPYKNGILIHAAGPIASISYGSFLVVIAGILLGKNWRFTLVSFAIAVVLLLFRKVFSRFIIPLFSPLLLFYLAHSLFFKPESISGPVGIVKDITHLVESTPDAFLMAGALSIGIGLMNLLPLMPFDGGKYTMYLARKLYPPSENYVIGTTAILTFALIIFVFVHDFFK